VSPDAPGELPDPVGEGHVVDPVAPVPQPADQDGEQGVLGAGEMIGAAGRALGDRDVPDGGRADVGGHVVERQVDLGRQPGVGHEPDQRAHLRRRAPGAGVDAADDVQRPVDRDREARAARVPQQFLGDVLGLDVAHPQLLGVPEGRLLGYLVNALHAEAGQHGRGRHVVHGDAAVLSG
jgi:hypothetical protein